MVGAIRINDPEVGIALVGHGIGETADVDDFLSVRGDLRVEGLLDLEFIHGGELVQAGVLGRR